MTPYIFASLLLHLLFVAGMVWGGIRFGQATKPLPSATVVHLVRRAGLPAQASETGALTSGAPEPKKPLVAPSKEKATSKKTAPASPAGTAKSKGEGRSLSGAAGTMRVGGDFAFDWYLALIQSKIEQNFRPPPGRRKALMAILEFRISKGGEVVGLQRKQSSGDFLFDQAAERAVRAAGRFPPLPANFDASELGINFEFMSNPSQ
ncbi:MAG: TonB family protein [bacterium]